MKHKPLIILGSLTGLSLLLTLLCFFVYFFTSGAEHFFSYPFYQQISLYLYQTQDNVLYAIFRIPGPLLLGGLAAYWLLFLILLLPVSRIANAIKKKRKKKAKRKFLDKKSFKAPGLSMFFKWIALLAYFAFVFLFTGYYLNDIAVPSDFWIKYALFYMYGILGGIFVNHLFNFLSPCKSNRYFELGFFLLLAGGCFASYFFLDKLGISLIYYIHSCILLGVIALINASDFTSIDAYTCKECGGRCTAVLVNVKYKDLGTSIGFEDRYQKVGTRETTVTISDDHGNTVAEGKGSEDIYEKYIGTYETENWETVYTYDCECIYCHSHHEETKRVHHSRRI